MTNESHATTAGLRPPVIGSLSLARGMLAHRQQNPLDFLVDARSRYGDVFTVDLALVKITLLNHPKYAQHVLRDHAGKYGKSGPFWESFRSLLGNGLLVSEGDFWRRQRRMMQPEFHRERLALLGEQMLATIREAMDPWEAAASAHRPLDLATEFASIALKVVVRAMFGTTISRDETIAMAEKIKYVVDDLLHGMFFYSLPPWLPVPGRHRYRDATDKINNTLLEVIARRRREADIGGDMISMLLKAVDVETQEQMTDEQLRDEALTMFMAGSETTATGLSWTAHFLLKHPEHARAVQEEVDTVLGGREVRFADLSQLKYTLAFLQESLRLASPGYWIPRQALEDDVIGGYTIPAGTMVAPMIHLIHRHPDIWEDPERFDPSRFLAERSARRHSMAWMPFGAGQRQCIGKDFTLIESQMILARLVQRFEVYALPGREVKPYVRTTLRPRDGVWVHLKKRERHHP